MVNKPIFLHATNPGKVQLGLNGFNPFEIQCLRLFETKFFEILNFPVNCNAVVITSQKTVSWLRHREDWCRFVREKSVYVVGEHTEQALKKLGIQSLVTSKEGFSSLHPHLSTSSSGVLLGGEHLAPPALTWLQSQPNWESLIVYRQVQIQSIQSILWDRVSVVLATSPRILDRFTELGLPKTMRILTLGETTQQHAFSLGFSNVYIGSTGSILETCRWFVQNWDTL
jgi:uroporphyrinogen-III synthase